MTLDRSQDGQRLYPMLEGPLTTDSDQRRLIINEFDIRRREYTGRQWFYRLEQPTTTGQSIGDFNAVSDSLYIVIDRDNFEGPAALFKKLYAVSLDVTDAEGFLAKHEIGDLLQISDPDDLAASAVCSGSRSRRSKASSR
jgi:glycerophosphoryl diester phosphodiesterase